MHKATILIMVILFVLLGISVFVVLNTLNQQESLQKTNKTLQERTQEAESRELKTIEQKKALEQEKTNLESQLKQAQEAKAEVQKKLDEANEKAATIDTKVNGFNAQINSLAGERDDWKKRVDGLKKERDDAMTKLQEISSRLAAKESELQEAKSTVTASTAQPSTTPAIPPADAGDDYWAGTIKQKASLEVGLKELQDQLSKDAVAIADLKKKSSDLELELNGLKSEKMDVERKLKFSEDLASNLSLELARLKNDRKMGIDQLEQLQQDNDDLRTEVKNLSSSRAALEKSITHLSQNKSAVENKLDETKNLIQGKIDEIVKLQDSIDQSLKTEPKQAQLKPMIDDLLQMKSKIDQKYQGPGSKEVELQPIIVNAESPVVQQNSGSYSGFQGHIVTVNEPNNFVVIDIGENTGLNVGDQLKVFHGVKSIARVEVIQVRKEVAAADISEKTSSIQVGDIVR